MTDGSTAVEEGPACELVRFDSVVKRFRTSLGRRQTALDGFSMTVPRGSVVGLLGPNGSGKTTALKALLGLVRTDAGTIQAFGHQLPAGQKFVAPRIGALIEGPAFTASLSGEHNLRLFGELHGVGAGAVAEVLELVGLTHAARRPFSGYSLGMKQRLGVAGALLAAPELLVLDEPMNGLDPEAVRDMRELFTRLRDERGMTVVVSSHILAEVEMVCDRVTIVRHGKVICDAPVSELLDRGAVRTVVRIQDVSAARSVLESAGLTVTVAAGPHGSELHVDGAPGRDAGLVKLLAEHRLYPEELRVRQASLEDVYITAIRKADAAQPATGSAADGD
ncbi:ABC transporter ATP-binding protein [Streptomyces ficellus]|uniref:ABC transporter ATP-binding protein n=1 Tax=Streptomyces ficellus TaxID=1977088 RepID=A0A6I6FMK6_9ACTN|nr:ABC transporter ATP-binding protein [Streptomyces ficellus]QGV78838.1 ABC transporter ATP-binding protein [Streptomyces ficellus]